MNYFETTDWLNIRTTPVIATGNKLGILPPGTVIKSNGNFLSAGWLKIQTNIGGTLLDGYASSKYLKAAEKPQDETDTIINELPPIHLNPNGRIIKRDGVYGREYPLNEPGLLTFDLTKLTTIAERVSGIHKVINWLDVEMSARYSPNATSTFCNIYAYDVAYCLTCYLPHVWWNSSAVVKLREGEELKPVYAKNISELNANATTDWFEKHSQLFNWQRHFNMAELQEVVNCGTLGIIVAQRINLNSPGHIVAVVPESKDLSAARNAIGIIAPLQSQAGRRNRKYFASNWWENSSKFRKFGFYSFKIS
jgi:hypothetical protein